MDYCPLDITVISASGLKNVNLFMKMGVYIVVSLINGDSVTKQKTHVSKGGRNPRWSHRIKFSVEESAIQTSTLLFVLRSRRVFGDRIIGEVSIPVLDLLDSVSGSETDEHVVEYQVRSVKGKSRGTLTFSHKFKEKISQKKNNGKNNAPQQCVSPYGQAPYTPPQGCNGQPQCGGGWYPQPYAPQQIGCGYNQQQLPPAAPQNSKHKKTSGKKKGKFGLGLGAGLIGGLFAGEMVSDAVEMEDDVDV